MADKELLGVFEVPKGIADMTDEEIEAMADAMYETLAGKLKNKLESPPAD